MSLTAEERHRIVIDYLHEINKPTTVFEKLWTEPALLTEKVLIETPAFWYLKCKWSRKMVEELFFKCRIEIDDAMEKSFDHAYGEKYIGRRWRDIVPANKSNIIWEKIKLRKVKAYETKEQQHDERLDLSQFQDALKINNIHISDESAQNIFNQIDIHSHQYITKTKLDDFLMKLQALNFKAHHLYDHDLYIAKMVFFSFSYKC